MQLPQFGVEDWLNHWEKSAAYDLAQSTISSLTMHEILNLDGHDGQEFYDMLDRSVMNYGWIEGSPEFKQLASGFYDHMDPDNILQTNGATGANLLAITALVGEKDHVIAEYPSYQQLYDLPRGLGADVDYWTIHEEDGWYPDLEELKKLIRPDTRMICLNNANNPTGTFLSPDFLREIVRIADSVGAYILVDEVYAPMEKNASYCSIVDLYDRGIAVNSLSKTYSVPGVRIGWTASNKETADMFRRYRDYLLICGGVFNDQLAVYVLRHRQQILERNRRLVYQDMDIYREWVDNEPRVSIVMPPAISTSFPKFDIPQDIEEFCLDLLHRRGVLLVPGTRFDVPGHVRLGYCTKPEVLKEGLARLSQAFREFD